MRPLRSLTGGMLMLFLSFVTGCAMSASGGWGVTDPIKYEMNAAMKAAPCTPSPVINPDANVNVSNGWTRLDPTASMPTCPTKSLTAFHCTKPEGCGEMTWTGNHTAAADGLDRSFLVDLAKGSEVTVMVRPARFFGVNPDWKVQTLKAETADQRFIVSGKSVSKDVTQLSVVIVKATPGSHVLQINQLEPR
jgi:hypothetical protein